MPQPKRIRFRVIRSRPTIASPPTTECEEIPPLEPQGMSLLSAEALPLEGKRIDKDLRVNYSPAIIYGTIKHIKDTDSIKLMESSDKTYAMVLRQGNDEIVITAESIATFAVIAKKFFDDAYIRMQVDKAAIAPLAQLDFTELDD
jgi:hypothetical protein